MRVWRISNYADLSGIGGTLASARWHSKGRPILYTAEHAAGALTEFLVHIDGPDIPTGFQLLGIDIDDAAVIETLDVARLPPQWRSRLPVTRAIGDSWLVEARSLGLRVPSVIVPYAWNVLLNPSHADIGLARIVSTDRVPLDPRLLR